jgi:hypothetical protein
MLEVLFYTVKLFALNRTTLTMGAGQPKKDPSRKRDAYIKLYLTKTKKQWVKNCAKSKKMSMSRYVERVLDGQTEAMEKNEFIRFLLQMRKSLQDIRDEIQHGTREDIVIGYIESAIDRINNKGREIERVKSTASSSGGSPE